jgi:hypothetical protein
LAGGDVQDQKQKQKTGGKGVLRPFHRNLHCFRNRSFIPKIPPERGLSNHFSGGSAVFEWLVGIIQEPVCGKLGKFVQGNPAVAVQVKDAVVLEPEGRKFCQIIDAHNRIIIHISIKPAA